MTAEVVELDPWCKQELIINDLEEQCEASAPMQGV